MAKVPFTKLGLTKNSEVNNFQWKDQTIEVKTYIPIQEKLNLIAAVINQSQDNNNFMNPVKVEAFLQLEFIFRCTNVNFTDKQKEDITKLYDLLKSNSFIDKVIDFFGRDNYIELKQDVLDSCDNVYKYRNSVYGILDAISKDYSELDLDASKIAAEIGDPNSLQLIKEVLSKMG